MDEKKISFLKAYVRMKLRTDPNTRSFLEDGTVRLDGKLYHQYFFLDPQDADTPRLANLVYLNGESVEDVYTEKSRNGIRVRVSFFGSKPRKFDCDLKKIDRRYGKLITYRDCKFSKSDLA